MVVGNLLQLRNINFASNLTLRLGALGITDPDDFIFQKKYFWGIVSNLNFLELISFIFTSNLIKNICKLPATEEKKKSSGSLRPSVRILVTGAVT